MCWDCYDNSHDRYKEIRQGGVDPEDFYSETNYKPKKKTPKVKKKNFPGCPGNEGKAHIYVWTTEYNWEDLFFKFFGFHKYEKKICCGCGKRGHKSRKTERYMRKFGRQLRNSWDSPEYKHEGFAAYRQKWLVQRGYTREVYGNRW